MATGPERCASKQLGSHTLATEKDNKRTICTNSTRFLRLKILYSSHTFTPHFFSIAPSILLIAMAPL